MDSQPANMTQALDKDFALTQKRKRGNNERGSVVYPRQRAITACTTCRVRKNKCTNERPACASCIRMGARCVYDDSKVDHSSFDPASLLILERLDEVLRRLTSQGLAASPLPTYGLNVGLVSPLSTGIDTPRKETFSPSYAEPLCTFSSVERILAWPIWDNSDLTTAEDVSDAVFTPDFEGIWAEPTQEDDLPHGPKMRSSLIQTNPQGQDLTACVENFLLCVHSRNPFLDVDHLRRCVSVVAELGPAWDPSSCLVLLAAALGVVAKPLGAAVPSSNSSHRKDADWATAETYYYAARRRFGLLDPHITSTQCYVLSGLYWIYKLRPSRAGQNFTRASIMYMNHRKHREAVARSQRQQWATCLKYTSNERRTYFTCVRLESEMLAELRIPSSGINLTPCTDAFPPPPESVTKRACDPNGPSPVSDENFISTQQGHASTEQATAWYYCLTETSLRRTIDQILDVFYKSDHTSWLDRPVSLLLKSAHSFEEQLTSWTQSLPPEIQFTGPAACKVGKYDHHFALRMRYVYICSLLYRPFLYIAANLPRQELSDPVLAMAHKAIDNAFAMNDEIGIHYRFEGTWAMCRLAAANILTLCAAKQRMLLGHVTLVFIDRSEDDVKKALKMNKARLQYWSQESPDLRLLAKAVEERCNVAFGSS
ncbi:uncharacterized protein M421DRAFT_350517 [Didymella exigua CBS 183.55]|uniref:Zn(2)-C6 fungal-type domain-containing protein n=1 Tax=Didymella exigua CBS 183.55 TaxID=1150837 RepID=A0A6A5RA36_9PLEO|nr:uncharacterized protein M421DRAFT_350517 [Didymella exigua CBS 183.55]KAF1922687.1 hypothetical protein M421DRAFT_350517 [Didymella exigua CBS 183.55]